ncbi:MAG TPA: TetR/AcrR family transcriptional regulator [Solirubrobacteraceae bacterium]|nr:TetR/AcrR family transcriptional regulator [Solirubrobacteraceae bacterium]
MSTTAQAATDRLPRGPHRLSRAQVEHHQRERILAAMITAAGTKGYGLTTIGDITRGARVSRDTFYEQFANKEACFLAAYDQITRDLLDQMVAAGTSEPSYIEAMRNGVRAYLKFWSERPDAARLFTLEVMAAGSEALAHREHTLRSFARLYKTVAERAKAEQPGLPTVPDVVSRTIVIAAVELTTQYIRENRVGSLPELENDVLYLWLMLVAGHEVAATALTQPTPARGTR